MPTGSPTRMDYPEQGEVRAWDDTLKRWVPVPVSAAVETDGVPFVFNEVVTVNDHIELAWNKRIKFEDEDGTFDAGSYFTKGNLSWLGGGPGVVLNGNHPLLATTGIVSAGYYGWADPVGLLDTRLERDAAGKLRVKGDPGLDNAQLILHRNRDEASGLGGVVEVRGSFGGGNNDRTYGEFGLLKADAGGSSRTVFTVLANDIDSDVPEKIVTFGHIVEDEVGLWFGAHDDADAPYFSRNGRGLKMQGAPDKTIYVDGSSGGDRAVFGYVSGNKEWAVGNDAGSFIFHNQSDDVRALTLLTSGIVRLPYDVAGAASLQFGSDGIGLRAGGADPGIVMHLDNDGGTLLTIEGKADEVLFSTNRSSMRFGIAGKQLGFFGAAPVAQPTAPGDTLAEVLTGLRALGLFA